MLDIKTFTSPTTRYQGSKRKVIPWIYSVLRKYEFDTVLDVFGGTGSVSYLLKCMGKTVYYNDYLRFNYLIGKALIENNSVLLTQNDIEKLLTNINYSRESFIQNTFKDIYYLDDENKWLDGLLETINSMNSYPDEILDYKKAIAYYGLFQSCISKRPFNLFHRKNLYIRTNDVSRSFGNKSTWDRSFDTHFREYINEINSFIIHSDKDCTALNSDFNDLNPDGFNLVYIDPPYLNEGYGKNETSNYVKCYHFLEGLARYSEWEYLIDFESKNRRFHNNILKNYFMRSNIHDTFNELIKKFSQNIIVISYKNGGIPSKDWIFNRMSQYNKNVKVYSKRHSYALNKQNGNSKKNRELLFVGY